MQARTALRALVRPDDCDMLGHMTAGRYVELCTEAVFVAQSDMGLTASDMKSGRRLSFAVVNAEVSFMAEMVAGDAYRMETAVSAIGRKSMTFQHRMFREEGNVQTLDAIFKCALMDLENRTGAEVSDDIRERAAEWMEEI